MTFPLFSDSDHKVAKMFGVLPEGKANAQRSTFVINKEGTIVKVFTGIKNAGGHPQEVLDYVQKNLAPKK